MSNSTLFKVLKVTAQAPGVYYETPLSEFLTYGEALDLTSVMNSQIVENSDVSYILAPQ